MMIRNKYTNYWFSVCVYIYMVKTLTFDSKKKTHSNIFFLHMSRNLFIYFISNWWRRLSLLSLLIETPARPVVPTKPWLIGLQIQLGKGNYIQTSILISNRNYHNKPDDANLSMYHWPPKIQKIGVTQTSSLLPIKQQI